MNDEFETRLSKRLSALDAAVPVALADVHGYSGAGSPRRVGGVRVSGSLPVGMAALAVLIVGAAVLGLVGHVLLAAAPTSQTMVIGNPHAWLIGNDVGIAVTITNTGSQDDKLVGVSSPDASTAGLYDTSMCSTPDPSNAGMGLCSKVPMRWWLIRVHETVQINGEIMLGGLVHPLAVGQTVEITLEFASASPVTMQVPVVEASVNP